ncbi:hypothetical protein [Streptosporangium carneum]|uniref:Uncharacterized protein n=1 Tax=Streptosporangium carneum TaxID=47481 RepID=A0A9W6HZG3_9ACTN|nr:hypothetical protein [Streptosporangium carneum]GLK08646.1 hypothetical protein GCM10017600_20510 [Streptosporangium carneum]
MRSAADLRRRWLETVPLLTSRTGMFARGGKEMETLARTLMGDLCFVDERDRDHEEIIQGLGDRFGKLGVYGPFAKMFGSERDYAAEVVSVYAEHFHRLGYLDIDRRLEQAEWETLLTGVRDRFEERDVRRSEVVAAYGPPSLVVDGRVLCYASDDWVFFDSWTESRQEYVPGEGRYERVSDPDPLIRSVRVPSADFDGGLILTLYGKVLRWGPGWWVRRPGVRASEATRVIAAQLRAVEARDPSQR